MLSKNAKSLRNVSPNTPQSPLENRGLGTLAQRAQYDVVCSTIPKAVVLTLWPTFLKALFAKSFRALKGLNWGGTESHFLKRRALEKQIVFALVTDWFTRKSFLSFIASKFKRGSCARRAPTPRKCQPASQRRIYIFPKTDIYLSKADIYLSTDGYISFQKRVYIFPEIRSKDSLTCVAKS